MVIVLWILGLLVGLFLFAWADLALARAWCCFNPEALQPRFVPLNTKGKKKTGITTVFLPGVLARALDQSTSTDPNESVFVAMRDRSDMVVLMDYPKHFFDKSVIVQAMIERLLLELKRNSHLVVVGASLGGDLFKDAICESEELQAQKNRISFVSVDAPAGASTLLPATRYGLMFEKFVPFGRGLIFGALPFKVGQSGLPKEGEVQAGLNLSELQAWAKKNLSGFNLRNLLEEGVYLLNFNIGYPAPYYMPTVYYIACTDGNVDVLQPEAEEAWSQNSNEFWLYEAETLHCAFLQQPRIFFKIFEEIYDRIDDGIEPTLW